MINQMTQTKNSEFDTDMECINHQIQMIGNSKNILNLGGSIFSDILDEKKIKFSKIKTEINLELCEYLDKLSIEDSWKEEVSKLNEKYDIIILDNLLDTTKHTGILLQNMNSILSEDGSIIASVRNNRYFLNTWETLGGIFSQIPNEHDYYEFNIDSLFTFLSNSHLTISKLIRIKIKNQTNLELNSRSSFPSTILEIFKKDPESDIFSYVVEIKKKRLDDQKTRGWVAEFPKNYFLESLKSEIEKNQISVESSKDGATIRTQLESQDDEIKRLEKDVEDEKIMTKNILESKREIKNIFENYSDSNLISKLQSDNMDKTLLGLQAMLAEYTELRIALKSSKAYNLMKKLDKIRGK